MGRLRLRTFIAILLDEAVRRRLVSLQDGMMSLAPDVKWVAPENLHVTMLFLGEVDALEVVDICREVREVCSRRSPIELTLSGVGCFPNERRPKVIWAGIEQGREALVELHHAIEEPLLKLGAYRREEREFTPHVTLGRAKGGELSLSFRQHLKQASTWQGGRMEVEAVHVMSSELTPDGPIYSVVSRERLGR
jgi:2'-5' RNA ligase